MKNKKGPDSGLPSGRLEPGKVVQMTTTKQTSKSYGTSEIVHCGRGHSYQWTYRWVKIPGRLISHEDSRQLTMALQSECPVCTHSNKEIKVETNSGRIAFALPITESLPKQAQ